MPDNRLSFFQTLSRLTVPEFEQLVFTLNPPAGVIPGSAAAQGNRVSALLEWAEGPTGCSLETVQQTLEALANDTQTDLDRQADSVSSKPSKLSSEQSDSAAQVLIDCLKPHANAITAQIENAYIKAIGRQVINRRYNDIEQTVREFIKCQLPWALPSFW